MLKAGQRWLVVAGMIAASFAGGACYQWLFGGRTTSVAYAQEQAAQDAVRARSFVLVDAEGKERATLGIAPDNMPALLLRDRAGRQRLVLGAALGETVWGLELRSEQGDQVATFGASATDGAGASLQSQPGKVSLGFGVGADGETGGLSLTDAQGATRLGFGVGAGGSGFTLKDTNGKDRAGMGMGPDGAAGFTANDADGKEVWRAP